MIEPIISISRIPTRGPGTHRRGVRCVRTTIHQGEHVMATATQGQNLEGGRDLGETLAAHAYSIRDRSGLDPSETRVAGSRKRQPIGSAI